MAEKVEEIQETSAVALRTPQPRSLQIRLLCGLILFISTGYCAPRRNKGNKVLPHEQQAGLYPELAALGFFKGCSPTLQSTVARIVALSPSVAVAREELVRQGIRLDKKAVRRIAEQLGTQMLALRQPSMQGNGNFGVMGVGLVEGLVGRIDLGFDILPLGSQGRQLLALVLPLWANDCGTDGSWTNAPTVITSRSNAHWRSVAESVRLRAKRCSATETVLTIRSSNSTC
jgi:hypothetical protein